MASDFRWRRDPVWRALDGAQTGTISVADGTTIAWQSFGEGPPFVFANGIGILHPALVHQIAHLRRRYRIITWDYRGCGDSRLGHPAADLSMPAHARDALAVLDALGVSQAVFAGWSMGAQVTLELLRQRPSAVRGFISLYGTYGRPFRLGLPAPAGLAVEALWEGLRRVPRATSLMTRLAAALPEVSLPLMKAVRFVGPSVDDAVFLAAVNCVAEADVPPYLRMMLEMCRTDSTDMLPRLSVPALVIAGEDDYLTPPALTKALAARIPDAEVVVMPGTTHYGHMESSAVVNALFDRYLRRLEARGDGRRLAGGER